MTEELITLNHGSGGRAMARLIEEIFIHHFNADSNNTELAKKNDAARLNVQTSHIVTTIDAHVISPLFFPGGDIGSLAVHGTINDLSMAGARPLALTAAFILEEGFKISTLKSLVKSMALAAKEAGVNIVSGDTKVVEKGKGDGVFITTSGVGLCDHDVSLGAEQIKVGDKIILSGSIGDHGIAVMSAREGLQFDTALLSDSCALNDLVDNMMQHFKHAIHCMRDPTRGGIASALNELSEQADKGFRIYEAAIPLKESVRAACELLGLDPAYIANEGKLVCFVAEEQAEALLAKMRKHPHGRDAAIIGEVLAEPGVQLQTTLGTRRRLEMLSGEALPRIC